MILFNGCCGIYLSSVQCAVIYRVQVYVIFCGSAKVPLQHNVDEGQQYQWPMFIYTDIDNTVFLHFF